jgi:carboxymethylenebutenolidase
MRAALKDAGKAGQIDVYSEAGHGFLADYRPGYNEAAAKDGWQKMLAWFKHNGV